MEKEIKIREIIIAPIRFDKEGGSFWDSKNNMIADLRGWGRIQYLPNPEQTQDEIGYFIADAITEKLTNKSRQDTLNEVLEKISPAFKEIKEMLSDIYTTCPDGWNQAPKGDDVAHDLVVNSLVDYKESYICDYTKKIRKSLEDLEQIVEGMKGNKDQGWKKK
ncbi:MAG: hypothetical protein M0R80_17580 [Proteobacteria bacterium]|jgi:hypothetical protein|nr:hypothetical protein [Pseudomonadota bacterium]